VGPDGATAERRFRFELAAHPGSPAQARRLTLARLTGWSVCEDTCDSAALVVSELVTNAIVHTASRRVVCELHDGEDLVRIAVRDEGCAPGEPHPSPQRPEEEHGRGLLLVDALCHAWGAQEHGPGLLVWAELPRKADPPHTDTGPSNDLGWGARPKPGPSGTSEEGRTAQPSPGTDAAGAGAGGHADAPGAAPDEATDTDAQARALHATTSWTGALVEPRREFTASTAPGVEPRHYCASSTDPGAEPRHDYPSSTDPGAEPRHDCAPSAGPGMESRHDCPSSTGPGVEPCHGPAAATDSAAAARQHGTGAVWL
jgi:hypothetical protein